MLREAWVNTAAPIRERLEALWRERLARLEPPAFRYQDPITYVTGRRPDLR